MQKRGVARFFLTQDAENISDVLDEIREEVENDSQASIDDLLDAFDSRAFGPLLLAPGLIVISPVGATPTVPTLIGVFLVLVSAQITVGYNKPWIPEKLRVRSIKKEKLVQAVEKIRPWSRRLEQYTRPRLSLVAGPQAVPFIGAVCCLLGVAMIPLELLPFAVFFPGLAVCSFGAALVTNDGLLTLFGVLWCGAAGWFVWWSL